MKFSEAMLRGYEKVDGRQCRHRMRKIDRSGKVVAYCVSGAAIVGGFRNSHARFTKAWGFRPIVLNDHEKLPWEHIYGMAVAAGL